MEYKIVVIDSLWDTLDSKITREYFPKVFITKKKGYGSRHDESYLAVGKEDFICNHIMICKFSEGEWKPVCISKIILSSKCIKYGLEHPTTSIMRGHFDDSYYSHVEKLIEGLMSSGKEISYSGGFTVDRDLLESKEEMNTLKEIYCGIHTLLHEDRKVDTLFGFSCPRLHTDTFFDQWGITPVLVNGESPSGYPDDLHGEEVKCIYSKVSELSFYSKRMADKYRQLWEDRLDTKKEREEATEEAA